MNIKSDNRQLMKKVNSFLIDYFRWVMVTVLLAVALFGIFLVVLPKYQDVNNQISSDYMDESQRFQHMSRYLDELYSLKKSFNNVQEADRARIGRFLPNNPGLEDLMTEIYALADRTGVSAASIKAAIEDGNKKSTDMFAADEKTNTALSGDIAKINVSVNIINVNYSQYKAFLSSLENNLRLLDVLETSYSPSSGSANFKINAYYLKNKKQ